MPLMQVDYQISKLAQVLIRKAAKDLILDNKLIQLHTTCLQFCSEGLKERQNSKDRMALYCNITLRT